MARKAKKETEIDEKAEEKVPLDPAVLELRYRKITAYSSLTIACLIAVYMIASAAIWFVSEYPNPSPGQQNNDLIAKATRDQNVLLLRMTGMLDDIRKNTE